LRTFLRQPLFDYYTSSSGDRAEMTLMSSLVVRVGDFRQERIGAVGIAVALFRKNEIAPMFYL
jgi:hypothetical protein